MYFSFCMEIPLLNLTRLHEGMKDEIDEAIRRVMQKSSFILGVEVEAFEKEFSEFLGKKFALGVASGTDAITLALLALGVGSGDEVITTSLSAFPTAEAIMRTGAKPVYVDIDPTTFNLDATTIERVITARTKAIVPVHLYGLAADIENIVRIARAHKLFVVEDCAQAHGARFGGKLVGSFGDAAAFSFFPSKNLGALGDGGMVCTDDEAVAGRIRALRAHGEEGGRFNHRYVGFNSRLDGLQASVLRVKLRYLPSHNRERQEIGKFFTATLADTPFTLPRVPERYPAEHVYHLYVIRAPAGSRDAVRKFFEDRGVKTNVHYPIPLHQQPAYATAQHLPNVEKVVHEIISIPLFPSMTKEEIQYVGDTLRSWSP